MRDEDFEAFIVEMGEATSYCAVPSASIDKYRGILPEVLLKYWKEEGWCGYADGLFWTVNPDDYSDLLDLWLVDTPFNEIDNYHVIARSAFGDLYAWGEKFNRKLVVACPTHSITTLMSQVNVPAGDPDLAIRTFFAMSDKEGFDMEDNQGEYLFERALKRLGTLKHNELYGFEPALILGGALSVNNLAKLDLEVHLTILRQLSPPIIT